MEVNELALVVSRMQADMETVQYNSKTEHKEIFERLSKLETQSPVMELQFKQIMDVLQDVKSDIKMFKDEINAIKFAPGKKWDKLTATIIACVATGIVTFALSKLMGV